MKEILRNMVIDLSRSYYVTVESDTYGERVYIVPAISLFTFKAPRSFFVMDVAVASEGDVA